MNRSGDRKDFPPDLPPEPRAIADVPAVGAEHGIALPAGDLNLRLADDDELLPFVIGRVGRQAAVGAEDRSSDQGEGTTRLPVDHDPDARALLDPVAYGASVRAQKHERRPAVERTLLPADHEPPPPSPLGAVGDGRPV